MASIDELVEQVVKNYKTQEDFTQLFKNLKQRGLEAALSGELTEHSGYDKDARREEHKSNTRNGYSKKPFRLTKGP